MTENNDRVWQKKFMSEKSQGLQCWGGKRWKQAFFCKVMIKKDVIANKLLSYFLCLSFPC